MKGRGLKRERAGKKRILVNLYLFKFDFRREVGDYLRERVLCVERIGFIIGVVGFGSLKVIVF